MPSRRERSWRSTWKADCKKYWDVSLAESECSELRNSESMQALTSICRYTPNDCRSVNDHSVVVGGCACCVAAAACGGASASSLLSSSLSDDSCPSLTTNLSSSESGVSALEALLCFFLSHSTCLHRLSSIANWSLSVCGPRFVPAVVVVVAVAAAAHPFLPPGLSPARWNGCVEWRSSASLSSLDRNRRSGSCLRESVPARRPSLVGE